MSFEYVCDFYGVPACKGRAVVVNGQPGVIVEDRGNYIGVNLDEHKPGVIVNCHPTWKVEYGEMREIRKPTRSQQRYQDFLRLDLGITFGEYLKSV